MERVVVFYEGRVQGVGFRYTTHYVAKGFDVSGTVRNLPDGRVELIAQGERTEVEDFLEAIDESELAGHIRDKAVKWTEPDASLLGFRIAH